MKPPTTTPGTASRFLLLPFVRIAVRAAVSLAVLTAFAPAQGEKPPPKQDPAQGQAAPQDERIGAVIERIQTVEADGTLDDDVKSRVLELLKGAQAELQKAVTLRKQAAEFQTSIESAPKRTAELQLELTTLNEQKPEPLAEVAADVSASDLDVLTAREKGDAVVKEQAIDEKEQLIKTLDTRIKAISEAQAAARAKLAKTQAALEAAPPQGEHPLVVEASRTSLEADKAVASEQLAMLEQETLSLPMRRSRLNAELALETLQRQRLEARIGELEKVAAQRRSTEAAAAKSAAEKAREEALNKDPAIRELAEANAELGNELTLVNRDLLVATSDRDAATDRKKNLEDIKKRVEGRLEHSGVSGVGGDTLRTQRQELPEVIREARNYGLRWTERLAKAESRRFHITTDLHALSNLDTAVKEIERQHGEDFMFSDDVRAEVMAQLESQKTLLTKLASDYDKYIAALRELDSQRTEMAELARSFSIVLDEWLLWIPNADAPGREALDRLANGVSWITGGELWDEAVSLVVSDAGSHWAGLTLMLIALVALLAFRRRLRQASEALGKRTRRVKDDNLSATLIALVIDALLAAPLPLVLLAIGWRLTVAGSKATHSFTTALGAGLQSAGLVLLFLLFFQRLFAKGGVGEVHLRWPRTNLALVSRHSIWLGPVVAVAFLVIGTTEAHASPDITGGLDRLALVIGLLAAAVFIQRVFRPGGALIAPILAKAPDGWIARLRWVWYPLAVGTPVVLTGWALAGYYFTALQLGGRLLATAGLLLGIVLGRGLVRRWLLIEQRRLAVQRFLAQRAQQLQQQQQAADGTDKQAEAPPAPDDLQVDISTINEQSRSLVQTLSGIAAVIGLWLIWSSVLPALNFMQDITLWSTSVVDEAGRTTAYDVTLESLALVIVTLIFTWTAAQNLPGVLEIAVLKNLPLEPAVRYAITTISRYLLTGIGVVFAFNVLGFGWAKVQWLVAALSVGLGFGLQEIIANFVCGLILLFERPIRVGDWVTVGDTQGTVSRIRIRATTITNWDRMELIIPNKELITGRVLNWSLTNTINRIVVNVGVAYGSDTEKARQLLLAAARNHPEVLEDPAPNATFQGFGDSTLTLVLRCYLGDFSNRLGVTNDLHTAVDKAFKDAEIEIAFPQLDLHVRSAPERAAESSAYDASR